MTKQILLFLFPFSLSLFPGLLQTVSPSLMFQGQPERLILHQQAGPLRAAGELQRGRRLLLRPGGGRGRRFPAAAARRLRHHAGGHGAPLQRCVCVCMCIQTHVYPPTCFDTV